MQKSNSLADINLASLPPMSALQYQLGLYEENFLGFQRLFGNAKALSGCYQASVLGMPDLYLEVVEQSSFTTVLHLTHAFAPSSSSAERDRTIDPSSSSAQRDRTIDLSSSSAQRDNTASNSDLRFHVDPSAWIRIYHDTKQAEITHCYISRHLRKLFDTLEAQNRIVERRAQLNNLFSKWLNYLLAASAGSLVLQRIDRLPFEVMAEANLELMAAR